MISKSATLLAIGSASTGLAIGFPVGQQSVNYKKTEATVEGIMGKYCKIIEIFGKHASQIPEWKISHQEGRWSDGRQERHWVPPPERVVEQGVENCKREIGMFKSDWTKLPEFHKKAVSNAMDELRAKGVIH